MKTSLCELPNTWISGAVTVRTEALELSATDRLPARVMNVTAGSALGVEGSPCVRPPPAGLSRRFARRERLPPRHRYPPPRPRPGVRGGGVAGPRPGGDGIF